MSRLRRFRPRNAGEPGLLILLLGLGFGAALLRAVAVGPESLQAAARFTTGAVTTVLVIAGLGALLAMRDAPEETGQKGFQITPARLLAVAFVILLSAADSAEAAAAGISYLLCLLAPEPGPSRRTDS